MASFFRRVFWARSRRKFWRLEEKFCPVQRPRSAGKLFSIHSNMTLSFVQMQTFGIPDGYCVRKCCKINQTNKQTTPLRSDAEFTPPPCLVPLSPFVFSFLYNFEMLDWTPHLSCLLLLSTLPSKRRWGGGGGGGIIQKIHFIPAQCCVLSSLAIFKQGTVWSYSREGVVGWWWWWGSLLCNCYLQTQSSAERTFACESRRRIPLIPPPPMCHRQWIGLNWKRGAMTPAPSCSRGATSSPTLPPSDSWKTAPAPRAPGSGP